MKNSLILVALNNEQIEQAKAANGHRKKITHALLCGSFGQIYGTEKQCLKYYSVWKEIFQNLFEESKIVHDCKVTKYESTIDLVNILISASDSKKQTKASLPAEKVSITKEKKKGFWTRIFG